MTSIDLVFRTSLILNNKYYEIGIHNVLNITTEMYRIGNKESKYFESLKDNIGQYEGVHKHSMAPLKYIMK